MFLRKQGEWVWLKKFEAGVAPDLRPSSLSLLRKVGTSEGGTCSTHPHWSELVPFIMITAQCQHLISGVVTFKHQHPASHASILTEVSLSGHSSSSPSNGTWVLRHVLSLCLPPCTQPCICCFLVGQAESWALEKGFLRELQAASLTFPQDYHHQRGTWEEGQGPGRPQVVSCLHGTPSFPVRQSQCHPAQGICEEGRKCIGQPRAVPSKWNAFEKWGISFNCDFCYFLLLSPASAILNEVQREIK